MKWSAHIEYDQGRLGSAGIYGLHSRAEAIAWLERALIWKLCWYLWPSVRIEEHHQ
jgi:hypothetical protein